MKRIAFAVGLSALAMLMVTSSPSGAGEVAFAPLSRSYSPPPLSRRQGWLTISNRDWHSYSIGVDGDNLFLYRGDSGFRGMVIPSGTTISIALKNDTYDLYGSNPDKLRVRIREGRTTTLSLEPFGYHGNTGLVGVVNDGDRVRNGVIFDSYATTVVVPHPPVVVAPPPPPPVIIHRPPYRPPHRPVPPPSRPPRPGGRDNGWNIIFGFGKR